MDRENALSTIASFDTELYTFFQEEVQRQNIPYLYARGKLFITFKHIS